MFSYFKKAKRHEISALQKLEALGQLPLPSQESRPSFSKHLNNMALIAEYKRASPSQGSINISSSAAYTAALYKKGGASAISVLTEKSKFKGRLKYIDEAFEGSGRSLPILRKDFIFHPLQIAASASTTASAILLIVKLCPQAAFISGLIKQAAAYGLESVVEVFDESDLDIARQAGARLIQVNARDFSDLSVDLQRPLKLAAKHRHKGKNNEIWIAASGFNHGEQIKEAECAGFDAALIGTTLMKSGDPCEAISRLKDYKQK